MIKTKVFSGYYEGHSISDRRFIDVDVEINRFLEKCNVEVIDIKFTATVDKDGQSWYHALMIYKDYEVKP